MAKYELGGEKAWICRQHNGWLMQSYQWIDGEPCMCVYPPRKEVPGALVIPMKSVHLWVSSAGYPELDHAIPTAVEAAKLMGLRVTKDTIHAIIDAVLDGVPDLIDMPPEPTERKKADRRSDNYGELSVIVNGNVVSEREIPIGADGKPLYMH